MNRNQGIKIAEDHLKVGRVYRLHTPIGQIEGQLLNRRKLEVEIVTGELRSRGRNKVWRKGDVVDAPIGTTFYEIP